MSYSRLRVYGRTAVSLIKFGCFVHVFNHYVGEFTWCIGPSMLPTFNTNGDIIFVDHLSPRFGRIDMGDVVVATSPLNPKRTPGDVVCVDPSLSPNEFAKIPLGHVWLQGDNLTNSQDSRSYGPVPLALITGKVWFRIWPSPRWVRNGIIEAKETLINRNSNI
ncbi:mitochondrial inner membrane protease subunit 1 [Paraphysoderma sedebokerense]|nr:mitochondrial inner membrane protease subunit 1 [Paraphysoderma sedebokerense]